MLYIDSDKKNLINKNDYVLIGSGNYITIEFNDVTDKDNKEKVKQVFIKEIKKLLSKMKIKKKDSCLIIGLGNRMSTPDSLGPKTIDNLIITNHLYDLGILGQEYRRTSAIIPGVMGETGIETSDIIKSISDKLKPDFVIVIDALASSSIERVNKTN